MFILMLPAFAQEKSNADFFKEISGMWEGRGTLFGIDANFNMNWEMALDSAFAHLTFRNSFTTADSVTRTMNAEAFYDMGPAITGHWFDSRGVQQPLKGEISGKKLTIFWGSADKEEGKTIYEFIATTVARVTDYVKKDGQYKQFGVASYTRMR